MHMQPFNNQSLFSDYYLTELIKDDKFWQESFRQAEEAHRKIKEIFQKAGENLAGLNEAETERRIIRPILDSFGHIYSLQPSVDSPEGIRRPDFAFFVDTQTRDLAEREHKGKREFFATCLAVGDAKHWDRALDKKTKGSGDPFSNYNPSCQIDFYLRATDSRWGILSNGRLWRLYNREASYRYDVFYEVDLPALLGSNDLSRYYNEAFNYFFAFFRKEAFLKDVSGLSFLDRAYKGSLDYAAKLGEELKENVYEALRFLAEGFLKFPANGLTENDLNAIRENIFVLIYRILFLLYAEDRRILPVDNPNYQVYSLRNLAHEIAQKLDGRAYLSPTMVGYWSRLIDLFRIVNEGDDSLDVPPYNGGLFDNGNHSFLADYKIGDSFLAQAIDQLTRAQTAGRTGSPTFVKSLIKKDRGFVSYRDMEIRHIGSIYEGLLEHHLRQSSEDLAVVKEEGREKFIPLALATPLNPPVNGGKKRSGVIKSYHQGSVYLETDKGERKATGSYYTPDYIVKYIVENTVGPLLEEKKKVSFEHSQSAKKEIESLTNSISTYKARLSKATTPFMQKQYQEKIDREQKRLEALRTQSDPNSLLISEIQQIKVLDPAMGSGHFLVEATDFLARALVEALGASPHEVTEEDIRWARREVVERCIYGVDLNPLAVELAKLSLWLYTVSKGRPLSFLEHHLRLGNSLIGAKIEDIGRLPVGAGVSASPKGKRMLREALTPALSQRERETEAAYGQQLTLFDESAFTQSAFKMVGGAQNIEKMPTDSVAQVKKKEEILATVLDANREPYRKIADLWTSAFFGNDISQPVYQQAMSLLQCKNTTLSETVLSPYIARAEELRKQKRFFHWELEFPEVFFDEYGRRKENPGFDAVIGNPPYINIMLVNDDEINFFTNAFNTAFRRFDLFVLFSERALTLLKVDGYHAFIVPDKILSETYAKMLRGMMLKKYSLNCILDATNIKVFPDAAVSPIVYVVQKVIPSSATIAVVTKLNEPVFDSATSWHILVSNFLDVPEYRIRLDWDEQTKRIINRINFVSFPASRILYVSWGAQPGEVNKFFFYGIEPECHNASGKCKANECPSKRGKCKPLIKGGNVTRYEVDYDNAHILYDVDRLHRPAFPELFESEKIIVCEVSGSAGLICAYDGSGYYTDHSLSNCVLKANLLQADERVLRGRGIKFVKGARPKHEEAADAVYDRDTIVYPEDVELSRAYRLPMIIALFNASTLGFYYRKYISGELNVFPEHVRKLPIRRISFNTPKEEREQLVEEGKRLCAAWVAAQVE